MIELGIVESNRCEWQCQEGRAKRTYTDHTGEVLLEDRCVVLVIVMMFERGRGEKSIYMKYVWILTSRHTLFRPFEIPAKPHDCGS